MDNEKQPTELPKLTPKQQRFVDAYVGPAQGNGRQACRLAGYRGDDNALGVIAHENLTKLNVKAHISARAAEYAMSPEEVLARLADQARSSMEDFITVPEAGRWYLDMKKAEARGKLHLIKEATWTEFGPSIKLQDSYSALVQLGKYHGLWTDKQQVMHEFGANAADILGKLVPELTPRGETGTLGEPDTAREE